MSSHMCGCYFSASQQYGFSPTQHSQQYGYPPTQQYLPRVAMDVHATIRSTAFCTRLTQVFTNAAETSIDELRYTFPLYDGVSIIAFECVVRDKVIEGLVKEKDEARTAYQTAKSQGQTAVLLEQLPSASDVFTTSLGNVPANADVTVNVTYIGELKHDAEVDGMRFTLPTSIAPRYGWPSGSPSANVHGKHISMTIDVDMDSASRIQKVVSPSHNISVTLGNVSKQQQCEPVFHRASAALAAGTTELANDFVLQVVAKNIGVPKALLETHPSIPGSRALMTTVVPKFSLKPIKPEIIFVADRSGSMSSNMETLRAALHIFLKSLPVGVLFNICSFGSRYELLWPKSKAYSHDSLQEAQNYVDTFQANFGGTETLKAMEASIGSMFPDIETEVMLLTDGEIWQQDVLFQYVNSQVMSSDGRLRVFPIGIGRNVSSALIEGVARAGNGFAQMTSGTEHLDIKLVRMLKAALTPHVTDYTLKINYSDESSSDETDFEIVGKVADGLQTEPSPSESDVSTVQAEEPLELQEPISLFDTNAEEDVEQYGKPVEDKYAHLPKIKEPKVMQAPHTIPPLFPFSRTSIFMLLGSEADQRRPFSITLKGTCRQGPLELVIPIEHLEESGTMIHSLAARKAIQELEKGHGWLHNAKNAENGGKLLKETHPARFSEMVQREAVRLGVKFQVAGRWTLFVAVEQENRGNLTGKSTISILYPEIGAGSMTVMRSTMSTTPLRALSRQAQILAEPLPYNDIVLERSPSEKGGVNTRKRQMVPNLSSTEHDNPQQVSPHRHSYQSAVAAPYPNPSLAQNINAQHAAIPASMSAMSPPDVIMQNAKARALTDYQMQLMLLEQQNKRRLLMDRQEQQVVFETTSSPPNPSSGGNQANIFVKQSLTGSNQPSSYFKGFSHSVKTSPSTGQFGGVQTTSGTSPLGKKKARKAQYSGALFGNATPQQNVGASGMAGQQQGGGLFGQAQARPSPFASGTPAISNASSLSSGIVLDSASESGSQDRALQQDEDSDLGMGYFGTPPATDASPSTQQLELRKRHQTAEEARQVEERKERDNGPYSYDEQLQILEKQGRRSRERAKEAQEISSTGVSAPHVRDTSNLDNNASTDAPDDVPGFDNFSGTDVLDACDYGNFGSTDVLEGFDFDSFLQVESAQDSGFKQAHMAQTLPAPGLQTSNAKSEHPDLMTIRTILDNEDAVASDPSALVTALINAQSFEGWWKWEVSQRKALCCANKGISGDQQSPASDDPKDLKRLWATTLIVRFLEKVLPEQKELWELVVDKATLWTWTGAYTDEEVKEAWRLADERVDKSWPNAMGD